MKRTFMIGGEKHRTPFPAQIVKISREHRYVTLKVVKEGPEWCIKFDHLGYSLDAEGNRDGRFRVIRSHRSCWYELFRRPGRSPRACAGKN